MDAINPALAAIVTRLALADIDDARAALRRAAHVEWVSDQAHIYLRELWEATNATFALEQEVRDASAAAAPLVSFAGGSS